MLKLDLFSLAQAELFFDLELLAGARGGEEVTKALPHLLPAVSVDLENRPLG
jgi:hypothetical protein